MFYNEVAIKGWSFC